MLNCDLTKKPKSILIDLTVTFSYIIFLIVSFFLVVNKSAAQTDAVKYLKNIYGGNLDSVKTVKVYYFNSANGGIKSNISGNKYYQLIELEQDKYNRALHELSIKPTGEGFDTTYSFRSQYEMENELLIFHHRYWNWPNTTEYQLTRNTYTKSGKLKTEELIVKDENGKIKSYKKIIYEYDDENRLILKRDSSSNPSYSHIYEQIICKYHYDTLGVKCYIEENKVQHSGFSEPLTRTFITDSIGKTNRKYFYKLTDAYYISSEYVEFDNQKNPVRQRKYSIKHNGDVFYQDSILTANLFTTYNSKNQMTYYENKLESSFVIYVYNSAFQLIERSGKNLFSEHKEYFKYDRDGNLIEHTEHWKDKMSRTVYADYNKLGIAETIIRYDDKGEISHMTKREFTYW